MREEEGFWNVRGGIPSCLPAILKASPTNVFMPGCTSGSCFQVYSHLFMPRRDIGTSWAALTFWNLSLSSEGLSVSPLSFSGTITSHRIFRFLVSEAQRPRAKLPDSDNHKLLHLFPHFQGWYLLADVTKSILPQCSLSKCFQFSDMYIAKPYIKISWPLYMYCKIKAVNCT